MAYGLGISSVAAVGTVVYANRSPEFRSTVESKVPRFGSFVDSATTAWKRVLEMGAARWGDIKNIAYPGKSENVDLPVRPVRPDKPIIADSPTTMAKTKSTATLSSKRAEKVAETEGATDVAVDAPVAKRTVQSGKVSSIEFTEKNEEATTSRRKSQSVENSEDLLMDSHSRQHVLQPAEASAMEGIETKPVGRETSAPQNEDKIAKGTSPSSLLESEVRVAAENELHRVFQDYVMSSDCVIASLMQLARALSSHHQKVLQVVGTPEGEKKMEDIAGKMSLCLPVDC